MFYDVSMRFILFDPQFYVIYAIVLTINKFKTTGKEMRILNCCCLDTVNSSELADDFFFFSVVLKNLLKCIYANRISITDDYLCMFSVILVVHPKTMILEFQEF